MKLEVRNNCSDFNSYRSARVKSLFNAENGCNFTLDAELPIDDGEWKLGLIVGPSGSGKTSSGRQIFGEDLILNMDDGWPTDQPIVEAIAPDASFDDVTSALAAVGLGDVPAWLRPFHVLSNGEKFRAGLARIICEKPERVVIDEFTSVVDRQIAKMGALAFQKAWRRTGGRAVLLACHYDIIDWLEPDWIFDTATGQYSGRGLWRRPRFELEIHQTDATHWPAFEPHYYLKLPKMVAPAYYVGTVEGKPVAHIACSPRLEISAMRASRMVIMPEWQGAGIGMRFLNAVCQHQITGGSKWKERVKAVHFQTSHPGLCAALRRDKLWSQVSAILYGSNKARCGASIAKSRSTIGGTGYGGHFRSIQGFKYHGPA